MLIGILCLFNNIALHANSIYTYPTVELFSDIYVGTDKTRFVEEATYFTLSKDALAQIQQQKHETMTLQIPFGATKKLKVNLKKANFLADDFKVTVQSEDTHNTLSYSPSLFYRGAISGVEDAMVILSFYKESINGVLSLNGESYNIGKYGKEDSNTFVLYKERNINASNPFSCSAEDPTELIVSRANRTGARSNNTVKVYVECDYELYKANGSSAEATVDFTTGLFNVVTAIYAKDDIKVELGEVKVWATKDPYPTNSAKVARDAFGASLNGAFNGDIAHLLSNYKVNGTVPNGGSANIDALCDKEKAVGYTNITTSYKQYPTYSWTAYAVTHEIGHNLGSPHTHSCLWPTGPIDNCWCPEGDCDQGAEPASTGGTVMSYCHLNPQWTNDCDLSAANPGINLAGGFGDLPGALIRSRIDNANCLNNGGGVVFAFQANANVKDEACNQKNGRVTLTVSYGQSPYTYKWSNGATTKDLMNVAAGNYNCTITDAAGKTTTVNAKVNGSEPFFVSAGADQIIGCAEPIVTLDGSESKNGFSYDYEWSSTTGKVYGNVRKETISVSEPGVYVLTVSNEDTGCIVKDTVEVKEDFSTPAFSLAAEDLSCTNLNTIIKTSNSPNIASYQWSGPNGFGSTVARPTVSETGIYTVEATGTNGCTTEKDIEVKGNTVAPTITGQGGIITCENTTAQLSANSTTTVTYEWSGPNGFKATSANPMADQAGAYTVKVTAENGCTNETIVMVVAEDATPSVSVKGGVLTCGNPATQLTASTTENVAYNWTGPNNFQSAAPNPMVSNAGTYFLVITTANGCTNETSVIVKEEKEVPSITAQGGKITCGNTTTQLSANSTAPVGYSWTGPNSFQSTEKNPIVSSAGIYNLVVTTANGCTNQTSVTVTKENEIPAITANGGEITCGNSSTQLSATANALVTYQWTGPNNFQSTVKNPVVEATGVYNLIVTSESGCSNETSVMVTGTPAEPKITAKGGVLDCNHSSTTFAIVTEETDLTYSWTGPNDFVSNEATPTVSAPGIYRLIAKKGAGCATILDVEVEENYIAPYIAIKGEDLTCANNKITLQGLSNDNIQSYTWEKADKIIGSTPTIDVIEAGTYKVTVANENGCTATEVFTVNAQTELPSIDLKANDLTCANPTTTLKLVTLVENLSISWTGPENFSSIENSPIVTLPGTYQVSVTNAIGCTNTASVTVNQIETSTIEFAATTAITCEQEIVTIDASASTLKESVSVEWSTEDGNIIHQVNELMISVNQAGTYALTLRDLETECVTIETITIDAAPTISARIDNDKVLTCANASITLTAATINNSENAIFNWVTANGNIVSDRSAKEIVVDAPGEYTLFVTDTITGCSDATFASVREADRPAATISTPEILTCNKPTTTLSGAGSVVNATSKIVWSRNGIDIPNSNLLFLNVNAAGNYTMTITDTVNQCQTIAEMKVVKHEIPQVSVANVAADACAKGEGSIALNISAESDYEVVWNNGQKGTEIENLEAGIYTATITDEIGCQVVVSRSIQAVAPISISDIAMTPITCHDSENGKIAIDLKGGNLPYSAQWSNGETGLEAANLSAGMHTLEVVDDKGCVSTFDFPISAPNALEAEVKVMDTDVMIEVAGGTPDYQFLWSDGTTESYGSNLSTGNHEVIIEDANGCSITKSFEIDALTTSIKSEIGAELEVQTFPNPTTDYFRVKKDLKSASAIDLSVFSADGQRMVASSSKSNTIDTTINTSDWKPGTYFLRVVTKEGISVKKIQVVKL